MRTSHERVPRPNDRHLLIGLCHQCLHTSHDHVAHKLAHDASMLSTLALHRVGDQPTILQELAHHTWRERNTDEVLNAHGHVKLPSVGELLFPLPATQNGHHPRYSAIPLIQAAGAFLALELNPDAAVPLVVVVTSRTSADDKRLQPRSFCGMPQSIWALCLRNLDHHILDLFQQAENEEQVPELLLFDVL